MDEATKEALKRKDEAAKATQHRIEEEVKTLCKNCGVPYPGLTSSQRSHVKVLRAVVTAHFAQEAKLAHLSNAVLRQTALANMTWNTLNVLVRHVVWREMNLDQVRQLGIEEGIATFVSEDELNEHFKELGETLFRQAQENPEEHGPVDTIARHVQDIIDAHTSRFAQTVGEALDERGSDA